MYSLLLKKALPFTLTFVLGAALGSLSALFGTAERRDGTITFSGEYGRRSCRMRRQKLVAESRPLAIHFKPDAMLPRGLAGESGNFDSARVLVTFGADGKVQAVEPLSEWLVRAWRGWPAPEGDPAVKAAWRSAERAARQIRFTPETINSVPVSVTKEVEIHFIGD